MRLHVASTAFGASCDLAIVEEDASSLRDYAGVSIAFQTTEILDVDAALADDRSSSLRVRAISAPIHKDYDLVPGNAPLEWADRFDVSRRCFLAALLGTERVGGAVVVLPGEREVEMADGRPDLALLWDLRVAPAHRRCGIGSALLSAGKSWAVARGCTALKVETQDINVGACRFYARQGFRLGTINRGVYPTLPGEIQLLWFLLLGENTKPLSSSGLA